MKVIKDGKELVGKKIVFSHITTFAENITLATEDGYVIVIRQDVDEEYDERETTILNENRALRYIENDEYLRDSLGKLGMFDIEAYKKKKEEERLKHEEEVKARKLKEERELYEKLKAKFEKEN